MSTSHHPNCAALVSAELADCNCGGAALANFPEQLPDKLLVVHGETRRLICDPQQPTKAGVLETPLVGKDVALEVDVKLITEMLDRDPYTGESRWRQLRRTWHAQRGLVDPLDRDYA